MTMMPSGPGLMPEAEPKESAEKKNSFIEVDVWNISHPRGAHSLRELETAVNNPNPTNALPVK